MYDTILLPTDGSEGASPAVDEAMELAAAEGATVHALFVVDTSAFVDFDEAGVDADIVAESLTGAGDEAVERVADRAREAGVDVVTDVRRGRPGRAIREYADEVGADLIVMGTHGRAGLDRLLLGSVTEAVLRSADVPVLTVRIREE